MVHYFIQERKLFFHPEKPVKYYPTQTMIGTLEFDKLSRMVSERNTVSPEVVKSIIESLLRVITEEITEGKTISLGDFGSFRYALSSAGANTIEEVSTALIRRGKVVFKPGKDIKYALAGAKFMRISAPFRSGSVVVVPKPEPGGDTGGSGGNGGDGGNDLE